MQWHDPSGCCNRQRAHLLHDSQPLLCNGSSSSCCYSHSQSSCNVQHRAIYIYIYWSIMLFGLFHLLFFGAYRYAVLNEVSSKWYGLLCCWKYAIGSSGQVLVHGLYSSNKRTPHQSPTNHSSCTATQCRHALVLAHTWSSNTAIAAWIKLAPLIERHAASQVPPARVR
jgi:hypothetical protein